MCTSRRCTGISIRNAAETLAHRVPHNNLTIVRFSCALFRSLFPAFRVTVLSTEPRERASGRGETEGETDRIARRESGLSTGENRRAEEGQRRGARRKFCTFRYAGIIRWAGSNPEAIVARAAAGSNPVALAPVDGS